MIGRSREPSSRPASPEPAASESRAPHLEIAAGERIAGPARYAAATPRTQENLAGQQAGSREEPMLRKSLALMLLSTSSLCGSAAWAQAAGGGAESPAAAVAVDEVIVTAQKRSERLS